MGNVLLLPTFQSQKFYGSQPLNGGKQKHVCSPYLAGWFFLNISKTVLKYFLNRQMNIHQLIEHFSKRSTKYRNHGFSSIRCMTRNDTPYSCYSCCQVYQERRNPIFGKIGFLKALNGGLPGYNGLLGILNGSK